MVNSQRSCQHRHIEQTHPFDASGLHSMAQTFSAPQNKQEPQLHTSFGDCDGVHIHRHQSVLKPNSDASHRPVYEHPTTQAPTIQRNDKRSKSCFPRIFSQTSNAALGTGLLEEICPVTDAAEWKGEKGQISSPYIKHQKTATWQKSCSKLVPRETIVIVEDVDSSTDEEDLASYEHGFDTGYHQSQGNKLAQDRGRPLATRDSSGLRGQRFRCLNYEDSVSPFSLGSRASSASDASTGDLEGRAGQEGREGQCVVEFCER